MQFARADRAVLSKEVRIFATRIFLVLTVLCAAWKAGAAFPPGNHKVEVRDAISARAVVSQGGRLVADYGGFQLYSVPQLGSNLPDSIEVRDVYDSILLNASRIETSKPEAQAMRKSVGTFAGKRMHLVHFAGPLQPAWRKDLLDAGVRIVSYIPHNAYLVYGDAAAIAKVQALAVGAPHIQWEGAYLDDYKIHPGARTIDANGTPRPVGTDRFAIQLMADPPVNAATLKLIDQLKLAPIQRQKAILNFVDIVVRISPADLPRIAARPDVISIQPFGAPKKVCERADQIVAGNISGNGPIGPGYLAWLASKGFTQAQFTSFVVDVTDSGIDNGTTAPNHFGLYVNGTLPGTSRVVYNILQGTPNSGSTLAGCDGHGNLNTHIISGYDNGSSFPFLDSGGYHYGLGVCPFVKVGSSVIFDPDQSTNPDDTAVISSAWANGARISNNSWGDSSSGDDGTYNIDSLEYDMLVRDASPGTPGNQEMVVVFAAGNDGPGAATISPPGTAKNVITVGAAQNVQPYGGADSSRIGDSGSDNCNSVISFSGHGPCLDGRRKPDIMAPGTHVSGGVPQASNPASTGTALACFLNDGQGVSGGIAKGNTSTLFYPNSQQFYTASSGTSHSTPVVTGGCALVRQYFINNSNPVPSAAMTKAFLMNSTRYMTGSGANDTLWSESQGMGEMDLGMAFDGTPRIMRDELPVDMFTATGQSRVFAGVVGDTTRPFRVTIAWTDAPGSTTGSAFNNDLDLTVNIGGSTYRGNVFSRSNSVTGGSADAVDNVESVFLPAGTSGRFTVTVSAANINSVGVPNGSNALSQDFALVIYNAGASATMTAAGYALAAGSCTNGVVNAGEQVTLNLAVQNVGSSATTNLVGTLLAYLVENGEVTPGVTAPTSELQSLLANNQVAFPSGPKIFGAVSPGATATNSFSFVADGMCGETITAVLQLQDGPANLGTVSYIIPLGLSISVTNFSENFDAVSAGSFPTGWSNALSVASGLTNWTTENTVSDTSPNAAYCTDAANRGEAYLYSPIIAISSPSNQVIFRNRYNLEPTYDGGVLEIAIGGTAINSGTFTDIIAAGGSFVANGYNGTITDSGDPLGSTNPLNGREAWTGTSGSNGFVTTIVNLPPTASGSNIKLRWACGTDGGNANLVGTAGWWIDSVSVSQPNFNCTNCVATNPLAASIVFPSNNYSFSTITPVLPVTGYAPDNSLVTISNNGVSNVTGVADGNGIYSVLAALSFGTNVLTVNTNSSVTVIIALGPPTLNIPAVANPMVDVSGQGAVGATVSLFTGSVPSGPRLQTFIVDASGNFSGAITLPLGLTTLTATESLNGETSTNTAPVTVSVVPLAAPVITSPTNGLVMNKPTLTISGKATAGATLTISNYASGLTTVLGTLTVARSGRFSTTVKVPDGTNILFAVQEQGGVISPSSDLVEVINHLVPEVLVQPLTQTNFVKGSVTFSAVVVGAVPLKLFWEKNGVKIPGANSAKLTLSNLKTNNVGGYSLVASNAYGETESAVVALVLVTNLFPNLTGNYYGLFAEPNARFQSSGFATLSLNSLGKFSAKILNAGGSYSFTGALSGVGWGSNVVARGAALPPLTVVMNLNMTNSTNEILGTVSAGTNWTADLQMDRAAFSATNHYTNAGTFTMVFASTNTGAQSPGGNGFGTVKASSAGMISITGFLPDNTGIAPAAVGVSKSGWWPLYVPLYGRFGSLIGWIDFTNHGFNILDWTNPAPASLVGSNLFWFRTNADGKLYAHGFTNQFNADGSAFAPANSAAFLGLPSLVAYLSGGDLSGAESNSLTPAANGKLTASGSGIPGLTLNLSPSTGQIHGTFADPSQRAPVQIKGILLQDQTNAAGFFLGPTNSGLFLLTP
jgi:hypothetical protein